MSRVVARQLAGLGWTKVAIKRCLWEQACLSNAEVRAYRMLQWIQAAPDPETASGDGSLANYPPPEQIILCVAGEYHPTHNFWMQAYAPKVAGRQITLPAVWDTLITEAGTV